MRLCVLIPAYNEEGSIRAVLDSIPKTLDSIEVLPIVIDDGSTDRTAAIARAFGATVVSHPERSGLAEAFRTGLSEALGQHADLIATLDADGQYRGEELALLHACMKKTGADLVVSDRQVRTLSHMPWKHRVGNIVGSGMLRALRCTTVSDASSGFRLFTAEFASTLRIRSVHTYTHEMLIQAKARGFRTADVPVTFLPRAYGKSKLVRTLRHHILRSCGTIVRAYVSSSPSSLRVLFITRSLQSGAGGMQLYARTLLRSLRRRNDLTLGVIGYDGGRAGLPFFLSYAWFRILVTRASVVHIGDAVSALALPVLRFLRPDLRFSVTVYGLDVVYPNPVYRWCICMALRQADRIVAISRATADAAKNLGVDSARVVVLPCALPLAASWSPMIERKSDCPHLLLLGRQIKRKGTVWFLRYVLPELRPDMPGVRVTIAGDGPEMPSIRVAISDAHLQDCVHVLGCVSEERKRQLFAEATLFLMPNIPVAGDMEGFGYTCIEAAASGLPVVAARLEGIPDAVVDGVTGSFFTPCDAEDCRRAVKEALQKKWDVTAMREACMQKFNADSLASSYMHHVWH